MPLRDVVHDDDALRSPSSGPSIHEIVHKMRDDQNTGATFSGGNPPGLTINSGEVFEVQTLDASGGHITRNGEPQLGAEATPGRAHCSGGPASVIGPNDDPEFGTGSRAGYQVPGVTSGNPICAPVFVNGAEPGDTLQVDVISLKTGPFGQHASNPQRAA